MYQRRTIYYGNSNLSPLALVGLGALCVLAFFIALPIFLGALVVFGIAAGYLAWRMRKTMRIIERELKREVDEPFNDPRSVIIDVTPGKSEPDERPPLR